MRIDDIVKIGEIFEIKLKQGSTRTKLQELLEDDDFAVFQPTIKGLPISADHDQVFSFVFYRSDGIYAFEAQMKEAYLKDDLRLCRFRQVSSVRKHQRREAYRLPIILDIVIECYDNEHEEEYKQYKGKTRNLSEKSVQLTCFMPLQKNSIVNAIIYLNELDSIAFKAKVFSCSKPAKKSDPYDIVLLFFDCSDKDLAYVRRYILQQQINAKVNKTI